jgi:hypothetical protein
VLSGATPNRLLLRPFVSAPQSIYAVQRTSTPNGYYRLNELTGSSYFQSLGTVTDTPELEDNSRWDHFLVADMNSDGFQDLVGVLGYNTGSGMTELHVMDGSNGYQSYLGQYATALHEVGSIGTNFRNFGLGDYNLDGYLDLYYIKRENTGTNSTEVHILSGATNYTTFILHTGTPQGLTASDAWDWLVGDYTGDAKPDVIGILKNGTGTGQTEVHILNGATAYSTYALHAGTVLGPTSTDWAFSVMNYNGDGRTDIVAIDRSHGSGFSEARVMSGGLNYAAYVLHPILTPIATHKNYVYDFASPR